MINWMMDGHELQSNNLNNPSFNKEINIACQSKLVISICLKREKNDNNPMPFVVLVESCKVSVSLQEQKARSVFSEKQKKTVLS